MSEGKISASDELRLLCAENDKIRESLQEKLERQSSLHGFLLYRYELETINSQLTAMEILVRKLHNMNTVALSQLDAIKNALPDHKA